MLDEKQEKLIRSWRTVAEREDQDEYNSFIARWIAFDAYCYAMYASQAQGPRADLKQRHLPQIQPEQQSVRGTLKSQSHRLTINLTAPVEIRIDIRERYTEDYIFSMFAHERAQEYKDFISNNKNFQNDLDNLRFALKKVEAPGEYFVINMAKVDRYDPQCAPADLAQQNIIERLTDVHDLGQVKDVLYQIRCNIFHGEKCPGDPNDDRVVKAATPVLDGLLTMVLGPSQSNRTTTRRAATLPT